MVVGGGSFSTLTRKNGIKVGAGSPCSVEEVCLAVGEVIGHGSIRSAARMNGAVVCFVEKVEQAQQLVEVGVSVGDLFLQVSPLILPAAKVTLSNVPPFISDEFLIKELSRHGKVVSPLKKVPTGCKSPLLKHVVSHRRQLFMILNRKDEELNLRFRVRIDEFDYVLFATSSNMKCFGCGKEGHVIKMCPDKAGPAPPGPAKQQAAGEKTGNPPSEGRAAEEPAAAAGEPAAAAGEPAAAAGEPAAAAGKPAAAAEEAVEAAGEPAVVVEEPAARELEREEPLVCGARLDVCDSTVPGFSEALSRSGTVTLGRLIEVAGPEFANVQEVGSLLGIRSARLTQRFLEKVKERMTAGERRLLQLHATKERLPDPNDLFPDVSLDPNFGEESGPLLQSPGLGMDLNRTGPKIMYKYCVKILNKRTLCKRSVSVWTDKLGGQKPQWRTLYKPPVKKRTGDLQWRILHGAIATNSFLSVISPGVLNECPFCSLSESVFHVFLDCVRLTSFLNFLASIFSLFGMVFTNSVFISGVHYSRSTSCKSRILNYLLAEAKMAIYLTRRDKMQGGPQLDVVTLWKVNIRARLRLEFCFYRVTGNLMGFLELWGLANVLCTISDQGELKYNRVLL
ncbi:uncharacterized protein ACNS7B_013564 [Menidia menidia]